MKIKLYIIAIQFVCVLLFAENISILNLPSSTGNHIPLNIKEYIDNMYTCMCASDLIITRAGAMTLTEIMAIGRASVLIPYPYAAENHQYYNALTLQNANAGRIIDDKELTGSVLIDTVNRLADDPELLRLMSENAAKLSKRDAAGKILREITELMGIK